MALTLPRGGGSFTAFCPDPAVHLTLEGGSQGLTPLTGVRAAISWLP